MNALSRRLLPISAVTALLIGCTVYLLLRPGSIYFIGSSAAVVWADHLPSFFHTFAFAAFSASIMRGRNLAFAVIALWGLVECLAELMQRSDILLYGVLATYQQASTYDPGDLVAIAFATLLAMFLVNTQLEKHIK